LACFGETNIVVISKRTKEGEELILGPKRTKDFRGNRSLVK